MTSVFGCGEVDVVAIRWAYSRERLDQDLVQLFVGPPRPMKHCGVSYDHPRNLMIVTTNHLDWLGLGINSSCPSLCCTSVFTLFSYFFLVRSDWPNQFRDGDWFRIYLRALSAIYIRFDSLISVWLEINEFRTCWCYYSAFSFDGISLSGLFFEIFKQFRILANFLDVPHTNFDLFQGVFSPTFNPRNYDNFVFFDEFVCRGFSLVFSSVFYKSLF